MVLFSINNNMKQHNGFKKDMDLLSEAYGQIGGMTIQTTGNAGQAADQLAQDDGFANAEDAENKTGDMSDAELLKKCCEPDGSLKPAARDALAKLYGHEDAEHEDGEHHGAPTPHSPEDEAYM
tara:strand:+ start:768 stop:1136 length:369 start_codon:yes stop_codon:yes gene_type:complete